MKQKESEHSPAGGVHSPHHHPNHSPLHHAAHPKKEEMEGMRLKRKMQKAMALVDYYNSLGEREISGEGELKEVKSKMMFTQKEILRLCLESKKIIKDAELRNRAVYK